MVLLTTTLFTVTPALSTFTAELERKFEPVSVTLTLLPAAPLLGVMELNVGAMEVIVNTTELLTPPAVVTVTFAEPEALAEIANVAVISVALTMVTLLIVTPGFVELTIEPAMKLVPVSVTVALVPANLVLGLMAVRVGATALTEKVKAFVVPPADVIVTFAVPDAAAAIVNVAVI